MGLMETLKNLFRTGEATREAPGPTPDQGERRIEDQGESRGLGSSEGYEPERDEPR
jgi:hypothetical protein